jgi:hypothetical protein
MTPIAFDEIHNILLIQGDGQAVIPLQPGALKSYREATSPLGCSYTQRWSPSVAVGGLAGSKGDAPVRYTARE